jgi:HK97 family phage portal protein
VFSKEAYQRNIVAFRCIQLIASSAASVPWLLYRDKDEIEEHEILNLLRKPNPMQSGRELFEAHYAYDLLAGNCYMERVGVDSGKRIAELWTHRPDRMKIVPGKFGTPAAFEYTVNQEKKKWDVDPVTGISDILHVKRFNPLDDWYGQSPLEAMSMSVDSHNEATAWNFALLQNGARPSGALQYEGQGDLDEENYERLKKEIEEGYGSGGWADARGPKRQGRPMLLTGGLKWVQMMLTQMDMDWKGGKEMSAREIAIGYSVPEQLVGVPGQQTYNNYKEARMALYEDAVIPLLTRHAEALTNWLESMPGFEGYRIGFDEDRIPALAPRRESLWDKISNAEFLSIDEKRDALGYEEYKPADNNPASLIFVSAAKIPLDMATTFADASLEETAPAPEEGDPAAAPAPAEGEGALGAVPQDGTVQDLALNGAQIQALVAIVQAVVDGALPAESAIEIILVSFPTIDAQEAQALIGPAEEHEPPKPEPLPMMPGVPPQNGKPPKPPKPPATQVEKQVMRAVLRLTKARNVNLLKKAHRIAYGK